MVSGNREVYNRTRQPDSPKWYHSAPVDIPLQEAEMKMENGSLRHWLFRFLVAIAAFLIIWSFIIPWWRLTVSHPLVSGDLPEVSIFAYGLRHNLMQYSAWVLEDETPYYQSVLSWVFLGASVILMLLSKFLKGKKSSWLLGCIGFIFITYAAIALIRIYTRTGHLDMPLQGSVYIPPPEGEAQGFGSDITTGFQPGYYITYAAGLLCILLALLRNKIAGEPGTHIKD